MTAKAPEGRVRNGVGLAHTPSDMHVRDVVATVDMEYCTLHNSRGEIETPPRVIEQITVQSHDLAIFVDANLVPAQERVSLSHGEHIFLTRKHVSHRPSSFLGCQCEGGAENNGPTLFTTETTTHPLDSNIDLV